MDHEQLQVEEVDLEDHAGQRQAVVGEQHPRLEALARYRILDTEPERAFDDLTMLASQICGTPMALITLVDANRQWFKSRVGVSIAETERSIAFCTHAIEQRDLFIVPDARNHELFRNNPFVVGDPQICFYAGSTLVTPDGHALGTLCVLDRVPRTLTEDQLEALTALRRQAEGQLELRRNLMELEQALEADSAPVDYVAIGPVLKTLTKERPDPAVGLETVTEVRRRISKPLVAIGGITLDTARSIIEAGADSVAVISDLLSATDIPERTHAFLVSLR